MLKRWASSVSWHRHPLAMALRDAKAVDQGVDDGVLEMMWMSAHAGAEQSSTHALDAILPQYARKNAIGGIVDRIVDAQGNDRAALVQRWQLPNHSVTCAFQWTQATRSPLSVGRSASSPASDDLYFTPDLFSSVSKAPNPHMASMGMLDDFKKKSSSHPFKYFVLFSDASQELRQVVDGLYYHFSDATVFGMAGASTPFINGHPFTLFGSQRVYHQGVVGLAIASHTDIFKTTSHFGYTPVSKAFTITRAQGNIIQQLDHGITPAEFLLSNVEKVLGRPWQMNDSIYLGIMNRDELVAVNEITGSEMTRGSISVRSTNDFISGISVKFLMQSEKMGNSMDSSHLQFCTSLGNESRQGPVKIVCENGIILPNKMAGFSDVQNVSLDFL